jgi:poly(A) polymerase
MNSPTSNSASLIEKLPLPHQEVVRRLHEAYAGAGEQLALVGGIVRDLLLGRPLDNDLDLTTSADPDTTLALGEQAGPESMYEIGKKFGTIGFIFQPDEQGEPIQVEITTHRGESYPNSSRHPEVRLGVELIDDLARRDFTVNAIALSTSGELIDPFDGQSDLARGILRAVGDPDQRFQEDPLRLLRAARFVAQIGLLVEAETLSSMARNAAALDRISQERMFAELSKLLCGPFAAHGLETMLETGVLTAAMPELSAFAEEAQGGRASLAREKDLWDHTLRVVGQTPARVKVRWAALLHDVAKPQTRGFGPDGEVHFFGHEREGAILAKRLLTRLRADRATVSGVVRLVDLHFRPATYEPSWSDSAVRRLMLEAGDDFEDLVDLAAADVTSAREEKQQAAAIRIARLRAHVARLEEAHALEELQSPLDGEALMTMFDRPPGRWIAAVKNRLREMVIDGELTPGDIVTAEWIAREMMEQGDI